MQATKVVVGVFNAVWMPVFMFGLYACHKLFELDLPACEWQLILLRNTQIVAAVPALPYLFVKEQATRSSLPFQLMCRIAIIL